MAYYKLPWRSVYCRDCGGRSTTKWPICSCENHSPRQICRPLSASERLFCERCGTEEPGKGICRLCGEYPIDMSARDNYFFVGGRLPAIIAVPAFIALFGFVCFLYSTKPLPKGHWANGAVVVTYIFVPLALLARWQRNRELRLSRDDYASRHGHKFSTDSPASPQTPPPRS